MKSVYLAGPISGLNYIGATTWRDVAVKQLAKHSIEGLSPMRAKDYLSGIEDLDKNCLEYGAINVMSSPKGITTRDRWDTQRCDIVLANFLKAERISIGTLLELGWADSVRTPIIAVMEKGNVHEHAMVDQIISFKVETLEEALNIAVAALK